MEVIALILFIVFMIASAGDKKKKAQAKNAGQSANAAQGQAAKGLNPARRMSAAEREARLRELREKRAARAQAAAIPMETAAPLQDAEDAARAFDDALAQMQRKLAAEGGSLLDDPECRGGSMPHAHAEGNGALDDDECAGGSMEHTHTEGVSRAAHARRMAAIDAGAEGERARESLLPDAVDAQALRRAVVMAEVLGKPRALKGMRAGR